MVKFKSQWSDVKLALWVGFITGFIVGALILGVVHR
jgi:hypothetical protein